MGDRIKLGTAVPVIDFGGDAATVSAFAQTAEALGYDHLNGTDHVLGVNVANRESWDDRNTSADFFHDPFVLFGFISGVTRRIGFSTQVMILPQRQTALVAKQAACLDILSGGRFRLGVGLGWNRDEYIAMGENFHDRGKRFEEQISVLRRLWATEHVTYKGDWHDIPDVGINPLPGKREIPIWFGGHHPAMMKRIGELADGWIMLEHPAGPEAEAAFNTVREHARSAGRDPGALGFEVWVSTADGGPDQWRRELEAWKALGVTHVCVNNVYKRYHHQRIEGRTLGAHIDAIGRYREAVADLL